jgi:hypothetical protein
MGLHLILLLLHAIPLLVTPVSATPQVGCTSHTMDSCAARLAASGLADFCAWRGPLTQDTKASWQRDGARAYVCNYSWNGGSACSGDEIEAAYQAVVAMCGGGIGGWWFDPDWNKGYGFDDAKADWCDGLDSDGW